MDDNREKISGKEVKKLLKTYNGKLDLSIQQIYFIKVYELDDKRAVMDFGAHGYLFKDLSELKLYLQKVRDRGPTGTVSHILDGKFMYDDSFPLEVKSLEGELFRFLGISGDISYTEKEFLTIDKYVNEKLKSGLNADILFVPLIAYVGEYVIHNVVNGQWQMIKSAEANVWEPYVIDNNGNRYVPYYVVYKELYEYYPEEGEVSLSEHTKIEIVQYRVKIGTR